jgi:diguanylate cyclase
MSGLSSASRLFRRILAFARRPELLAFLPAITLAAFWLGGEAALVVTALLVPFAYALGGIIVKPVYGIPPALSGARDAVTGLALRDAIVEHLDRCFATAIRDGRSTACIALSLDDSEQIARRYGHAGFSRILCQTGERITGAVRDADTVARLDSGCFAVALAPVHRLDLESMLQLAARIQEAVENSISLDATTVHVSASVGFCVAARAPAKSGTALLEAAEAALDDARHNGPGAIRAYTAEMQKARADQASLRRRIAPALDSGEVRAYFQPQVSTDTGEITGVETLARWMHPERGVLTPEQFLPELLGAGLSERLGEVMLGHALRALVQWDEAGYRVPSIAVNFAPEELRNPRLPDKVQWELDRYGLSPDRLTVEILETVVAQAADDVIVQSLARLADLGCCIDLDDFGTGQASISSIRRFAVTRIKIDRCFVTRLDEDREQQRLVAAILSMAERLGLETLAEGVETSGEHAMLAQLGCDHVQGYAIARPMPPDQIAAWIGRHRRDLGKPLHLGKRIG